jgi:single-stranded-DNA-specific exonuclease
MNVFDEILKARGLTGAARKAFLAPDYAKKHDPFLLPDMEPAVARLVQARERQERVAIYGDYDIDGLSATALLLDAFTSFGFTSVTPFIPNRFTEGYGLTIEAIERLAADGAQLIVTVDTGSLSHKEVVRANELGVDVIVTDHHNVADTSPPAVATVNPKRLLQAFPQQYEGFSLKKDSAATFSDAVDSRHGDFDSASSESVELSALKQSSIRGEASSKSRSIKPPSPIKRLMRWKALRFSSSK